MKLKFFNVLQQFKKQIVDGACEQKEPEKFLTSEYIANSFWEFVRNRLLHNHTYSCISQMRRYRSNLQALFLVHPAAFIQVAVDQKQEYNC